jgi:hypothetical protein
MEQEKKEGGAGRVVLALFLGLALLAMLLPCTGGHLANPHPGMWHWGGFWFYPDTFFAVITIVPASTTAE